MALPWFRYVLGVDPGDPDPAPPLARALSLLEYNDEAIAVVRDASARLPSDPALLEELGFQLRIAREEDAARDAYALSEHLAPYRYVRLFWRAYALHEVRFAVPAWRTLQRYLEFYPDDPNALSLRSEIEPYLPDDFDPEEKPASSPKPSLLDTLKE